ncbi:M56 family metallopeptidase [Roseiconus nitratireducens]|uniref:M56 family metallopeptidase n=1 Tax=Roseiconus nitratireducens TaxID=2605748 RepID=A0A5M6CVE8_9BACT|nr:M56 family metallopeptidase [Roseiconus nitratireducens]KAA5538916.1 M56 family metallopeptidase [Roseiconus nitratireducens]
MDASNLAETTLCICLQVTLLVAVTVWAQQRLHRARHSCQMWTLSFLGVLALVAAGLLFPHRRWFHFPTALSDHATLAVIRWQQHAVSCLAAIWGAGVAILVLRRIVLCLRLFRFLRDDCQELTPAQLANLPLHAPAAKWRKTRLSLHPCSGRFKRPQGQWQSAPGFRSTHLKKDCEVKLSAGRIGNAPASQEANIAQLKVMASDQIQGPFCWQFHRPVIVLPSYLLDGDRNALRYILRHELEHLRTEHPLQQFLQTICGMLFWFHPAMWIAARHARLAREFACDEAAVTAGRVSEYLRTMATVAQRCVSARTGQIHSGTLSFGPRRSELIHRSERLVRLQRLGRSSRPGRRPLMVAILLLTLLAASQLWLPVNAIASSRSNWSPWPAWTANVLHDFGYQVRDFEPFTERSNLHELIHPDH